MSKRKVKRNALVRGLPGGFCFRNLVVCVFLWLRKLTQLSPQNSALY